MMDAAIRYAQMGLSVIPLHGKKPYFENWPDIATRDTTQIAKWWTQDPQANIGIATGRKSNVFVVDVDPKNGGNDSLDTIYSKYGQFPNTWTDITGSGGTHFYFRYPAFEIGNKVGIMPGIDIRGDGGQVVAPPSIHPDTKRRYMWDGILEPWDDRGSPPAEAPLWLLDMLAPKARKEPTRVANKIHKGVQHSTLVSLAGMMRRLGLDEAEIFPSLYAVNVNRCEQPGPEKNIRQIAHSMMRYQPDERSLTHMAGTLWRLTRHAEQQEEDFQQRVTSIDGYTLAGMEASGPEEVIEGLLHHGVTLFAGRPKVGKSFFVLQLAISVANGARFMGTAQVKRPGSVVYFALEEGPSRTAQRIQKMSQRDIALQNIEFFYEIKPLSQGGALDMEEIFRRRSPSVVIIDTLLALCRGGSSRRDIMQNDYEQIATLSALAKRYNTSILVVHHLSKMLQGDPFDAVAGTTGLTAACDCMWVLQKQPQGRGLLHVRGREIEEETYLMKLDLSDGCGWQIQATGEDAEMGETMEAIYEVLKETGALEPSRVASQVGITQFNARQTLKRMMEKGLVTKNGLKYAILR